MRFKVLAAMAALVMMLTGCGAAVEAAPLREDAPGANCLVDGNKICGPVGSEETDAWAAYDARPFNPDALPAGYRVDYRGTALAGLDFPPSEFYTLPSASAGMVHVFQISEETK